MRKIIWYHCVLPIVVGIGYKIYLNKKAALGCTPNWTGEQDWLTIELGEN